MNSSIKNPKTIAKIISESFDNSSLNLIILPTEKCNFRCFYCYEDFKIGRMSAKVVDSILALLDKRAGRLNKLSLSWFGGEPLLNKNAILKISKYAQHLSQGNGFQLNGNMTTNGYLLDLETATELVKSGVSNYQISIDGLKETHDNSRVLANGAGTFENIWSNLVEIKNSSLNISIVLRIHFSSSNYKFLLPLIDKINSVFGGDSRFSVFLKSIERLGGHNDSKIEVLSKSVKKNIKEELLSRLDSNVKLYDSIDNDTYVCYASKPNSLVIRANGKISKCTVAFNNPNNDVGEINYDGSLKINDEKFKLWTKGFENMDAQTLTCPLSKM